MEGKSLIETPFGGRYCGKIAPRQRISLYRVISIVFLTDRENVTSSRFSGSFSFIPDDSYVLGTPSPDPENPKGDICSFTIYSKRKKDGEIMTPTYPGTYPKDLECSYKFIGN